MLIMEFTVKCPKCDTETKIVVQEANPIMYVCSGCNESVVLHGNRVYNVTPDYVLSLLKNYKYKPCGQITGSKLSNKARTRVTDKKVQHLQELLSMKMDVKDFINCI